MQVQPMLPPLNLRRNILDNTQQSIQRKIDVLAFLSSVVQSNTEFYQSDFNYDIATLQNAAWAQNTINRSFYWMSRHCGTWCLREREVFLRGTGAFSTWTYYEEDAASIQAYRVVITSRREGTVLGDVFPLNYAEHVRRVKENALPIRFVTASFEDGHIITMEHGAYCRDKDTLIARHGRMIEINYFPESEAELIRTLMLEHRFEQPKGRRVQKSNVRKTVR